MKSITPLAALLMCVVGCRGLNPIPSWNRSGEFYSITRNYSTADSKPPNDRFCLLGKAMVQGGWSGGQSAMIAIPLPTLYLGIPIMWIENATICPVVDTLMLPRDLYLRQRMKTESDEGLTVEVRDYWNRPATNVLVEISASPTYGRKSVTYGGNAAPDRSVIDTRRTGPDGRCRFPLAMSSVYGLRTHASMWTKEGHYVGREEKTTSTNILIRLEVAKEPKHYQPTFTPKDADAPALPTPDRVKISTPSNTQSYVCHSMPFDLETKACNFYYGAKSVNRPSDFDAYWDGELKRIDVEVPFAADVTPIADLSTNGLDVSSVSFPTFGRTVRGYLSIPKAPGPHPVVITFADGRTEFKAATFPYATNVVTLALNVTDESSLGAEAYRRRNRLHNCHTRDSYAFDGISRGREAYFFHPVILGSVRGVRWLLDQPAVDPANVRVIGAGQSAGLGLWLMAFEPRIQSGLLANPSHLFLLDQRNWPELLNATDIESERWKAKSTPNIPYFSTENFAARIKGKVSLIAADDRNWSCQCDSVFSLFRALPSESADTLYFHPGQSAKEALLEIDSRTTR